MIVNSFEALSYIAKNIKNYPEDCLFVALVIADHMPYSFPTIGLIAEISGKSERTIIRKIQKLELLNLIKVQRRHRNSSIYTLILGDTALSVKKSLGDKLGVVRVTNSIVLGDTALSLQQTSITNNIKEEDLLNKDKSEKAKMDRKVWLDKQLNDFKSK